MPATATLAAVSDYVALDHPRFVRAQREIFTRRVTADCMTHACALVHQEHKERLDACCQYGVDVDVGERDAILAHREEISALLGADARARPWFGDEVADDADFPSGSYVRTQRYRDGCIFLAHDGRGCAIHRAGIAGGWPMHGVKPHVCRLFPLSYESDAIVLSDDYSDYSCARDATAPTVYQVGRATLAEVFGQALVRAMDRAERVAQLAPRRLPML